MSLLVILPYLIVTARTVRLTKEEQAVAGWVFAGVFVVAIGIACLTYVSWKNESNRK